MSSGVALNDNALSTFKTTGTGNRWKYIIFGLSSNNREIGSLKESNEDDYDKFLEEFPEDECRWAVYKYDYDSGEGRRTKVVFFHWAPDGASVRQKMLYASSKQALRTPLGGGVNKDVQASTFDDISKDEVEKLCKR